MLDPTMNASGITYSRPVDLTNLVLDTTDDLAPGMSTSKDVRSASSLQPTLGLGRPSTHSKLLPPSSFPPLQRRTASDSDTSMVSSSHSRPSLDSSPSQVSSSDSFPLPHTPTNDMPFSMLAPSSPISRTMFIPGSPTKRRKFTIPRKAPLRDTSSVATLKPNMPSTPPDPTPPPKTLRRTSRFQKLRLDLTGQEKQKRLSTTSQPSSSPPPVSFPTPFMIQTISTSLPIEHTPSPAISVHSADATLSLHNPSLTHVPLATQSFATQSNCSDHGPRKPCETSGGNDARSDAGKGPLLQFKPRGRVMAPRSRAPSMLNERSPFSPTAGYLPSTVEASQNDPIRPLRPMVIGLVREKDVVDHASSSSDTPEERAHAQWLRSLKNKTVSRLKSSNGLKELNELKRNVEICERRSIERSEGVRVRVRASNMVVGPLNRTSTSLEPDVAIGRSHSRLGSSSSASGMGATNPRTTPVSTPPPSIRSSGAHSRSSVVIFADLPHPEHHPPLSEAKWSLGSWTRRSSGSSNTSRTMSPSRPRRKTSLIGSMFSRPGSMSIHEEERDCGTEGPETMAKKTEEMMRAAVWGQGATNKASARQSQQCQQEQGSRSSVNINTSASASRSSVDVRSSRSAPPLPRIVDFGQMPSVTSTTTQQPKRRPSWLHKKSIDWSAAGRPHSPNPYEEPISPRTPVARPISPSHDEAARKSMGEFSEYVKTLPRGFAANYVAHLIEQGEKAPTPAPTTPETDKERRGSVMLARRVSRKISAVFVGKR